MVSDMVAAFWDGSSSGTGNCVRYARKVGKKIVVFSDFSGVKPQEEKAPSSSPSYREVHGDIFASDAEAIVNTVNCLGAMGKGIALSLRSDTLTCMQRIGRHVPGRRYNQDMSGLPG